MTPPEPAALVSPPAAAPAAAVATPTGQAPAVTPPSPPASPPKVKAPAKPKAKAKAPAKPKAPPAPKAVTHVQIGDYKIKVRSGSAYASLYKVMAKEGKMAEIEPTLASFDPGVATAAISVLKVVMVDRERLEKALRADPDFAAHCAKKTADLKKRAAAGDAKAKSILTNPKRVKNGTWVGDIREMLSVCNGSSSNEADNRNIKKYAAAHLSFRQFPRIPRRGQKAFVIMVPTKHMPKVNKALKAVFGDERAKDFFPGLNEKIKSVLG
jgi:hypothetical protein